MTDTLPKAHTACPKELFAHYVPQEGLRSQPKTFASSTEDYPNEHWTSEIYPVFTIPQCLSVIDQRKRMHINEVERDAGELMSEVGVPLRPVPPLKENRALDSKGVQATTDESVNTTSNLTSKQRLLREQRTPSKPKQYPKVVPLLNGGDVDEPSINCGTKLGGLKEASQYSTSSRSGHKSRIDSEGSRTGTPQSLAESSGLEHGRRGERLTVPPSSISKADQPSIPDDDRWAVTASPRMSTKSRFPGPQDRPKTAGALDTSMRYRASPVNAAAAAVPAWRGVATTQKTSPTPSRPSLVLPPKSSRNPMMSEQTYVLIHNRTSNQKQRNTSPFSPVLLMPTSARRRISASPVACSAGQTRAKTHSPAWRDLRSNRQFSPHQRPLTVRTTCGSGERRQNQQQTLPHFRPLYASVFDC
nr:unnamed protein product [Spirometra erinaceieuropaei]